MSTPEFKALNEVHNQSHGSGGASNTNCYVIHLAYVEYFKFEHSEEEFQVLGVTSKPTADPETIISLFRKTHGSEISKYQIKHEPTRSKSDGIWFSFSEGNEKVFMTKVQFKQTTMV